MSSPRRSLPALSMRNPIEDDRVIVMIILDKYKDHPSILAIVQDPEHIFQSFSFNEVVWFQLKMFDGSKSKGVDKTPPKPASLACDSFHSFHFISFH